MGNETLMLTLTVADVMGIAIILVLGLGTCGLMWLDYGRYREEHGTGEQGFVFSDFVKREQLYIFLFLMFLFLIGGEVLLYNV